MQNESPRESSLLSLDSSGFHRLVYSDWGPEDGQVVICAHVLTGNGHDFDELATVLAADGYRVIAPDLPGRGRSDFLPISTDYSMAQYVHDIAALLAHLGIAEPGTVDWIGSSLGGLLGLFLAGAPNSPVKRIVINDVGPTIPQEALDHISSYIGQPDSFTNLQELEKRLRQIRAPSWGPITEEQWADMAENNARALPDGNLTFAYDPEISLVFSNVAGEDINFWPSWDMINIPALILRGADSILLPRETADEMMKRGPGKKGMATLEVIEGCGHAPSLLAADQISIIKEWMRK